MLHSLTTRIEPKFYFSPSRDLGSGEPKDPIGPIREVVCQFGHCIELGTYYNAAETLGKSPPVTPAILAKAIEDHDPYVRRFAVLVLSTNTEKAIQVMPQLINALKDRDKSIRLYLSQIFEKIETAVPILISALSDNDRDIRSGALDVIGKICTIGEIENGLIPHLIKALDDKELDVRKAAATCIERINRSTISSFSTLRRICDDREDMKGYYRFISEQMKTAIPTLNKAQGDTNLDVCEAVRQAIESFELYNNL